MTPDQFHLQAIQIVNQLETNKTQMVITQAILLKTGNAFSKQRYRCAAVVWLESLENDLTVEIVLLLKFMYDSAFRLFRDRTDKEWRLADCISCVVMQEYAINDALTSDEHFHQMGFRPLLRS